MTLRGAPASDRSARVATPIGTAAIAAILVAITLNHLDRQMLALIKPWLDREFGWSNAHYGYVVAVSQLVAALCLPLMGWIVDRVPIRACLGWGVAVWSALTAAQGLASGTTSMLAIRAGLSAAEAVGTPAALRALGGVASVRRRTFAIGLFTMSPSVGAVAGALVVPALAASVGWRAAAVVIAALGFVWLAWWLRAAPFDDRAVCPAADAAPDRRPLRRPAVWLLVVAKALTDQLWWVFLFWLPAIFHARGGPVDTRWIGGVASIYTLAAIGSIAGGLAAARWQAAQGRAVPPLLALCGIGVTVVLPFGAAPDFAVAAGACAMAIFGHEIVAVTIFSAIGHDRYRLRTGTITGVAAFAGHMTAVGSSALVGMLLAHHAAPSWIFIGLALCYLAGVVCLLAARQQIAEDEQIV